MSLPDQWRAFLRAHHDAVRAVRQQTLAFVRGEKLAVLPIEFNSKHLAPEPHPDFEQWADPDYPLMVNFGAKFPPRSSTLAVVDLDVDVKPVGEWTPALEEAAGRLTAEIMDLITHIGGIDGRHQWGRASMGFVGHCYVPVHFADKAGLAKLLALTMRKPIPAGELRVRIEVRVSPDNKTPMKKPFTLPGSVYPGRAAPGFDVIGWRTEVEELPSAFPPLQPEPLSRLVKGLWAALLYVGLYDHWGDGNRHDTALLAAGVLARECAEETGFLEEAEAREIIIRLSDLFGDSDTADRIRGLDATLAQARQGRAITGYARLAELIGEEAKLALLRMRGGADPDALATLFDLVAYVPRAMGKEDVWLDLSTGGHGAVICTREGIKRHFHPHPHFPPFKTDKKEIALIDVVANSKNLQRYHEAIALPGISFRDVLIRDGESWRHATENELNDGTVPRVLNIGTGYRTPHVDEPEDRAWARFWELWRRHLGPVTGGNAEAIAKVEKAIAWAAQKPLEKIPLGLCFTGGGGIGKSVLFNTILPAIFGEAVFAVSNVLNLESQFRLADLEGKKFYVIEEVNLTQAAVAIKEILKDLMKNTRMKVNRKYGAEGYVDNLCIPIFLTNETNPGIVIRGQHERSLVLIQGTTRESAGASLDEWQTYRNLIASQVQEFLHELKDPAIREAAMAYFMSLDVTRQDFEDNSELGDLADPRDNMDPIDEAICAIIEANELHPKFRGEVPLTAPFKMEWLLAGIQHQLQQRNASRFKVTPHSVTKHMNRILGGAFMDKSYLDTGRRTKRIRYISIQYGDMIQRASKALGITLEPAYELEPADFGPNDPDGDACRRAAEMPFSTGPTSY